MSDTPEEIPDNETKRPLATLALFAYNQEKYVSEAVESAFSQTYDHLEIILSDDCSSDRTFEIMQKMAAAYEGPHKVILRKNAQNQGLAGHVNCILDLTQGEFVTLAAGDDISHPRRVEETVTALDARPDICFFECGYEQIDDTGGALGVAKPVLECDGPVYLADFTSDAVKGLVGAARSYRRSALTRFPPLDRSCPTEDSTFVLRCLMLGCGWYGVEPLVKRRIHDTNLSGVTSLQAMDYTAIWRQYRADADFALALGWIEKAIHSAIMRWIGRTEIARNLAQKSKGAPARAFYRECAASLRSSAFGEVTQVEAFILVAKAIIRRQVKT